MPWINRNIPPPNKRESFVLNDFTGGLNNSASDSKLEINQASDILNMKFNEDGLIETRPGTEQYDLLDLNAEITFIDVWKPIGGTEEIIRATDTELYLGQTKIADLLGTADGCMYAGRYYFVDGDKFRFYGSFPDMSGNAHYNMTGWTSANEYKVFEIVSPPEGFTPLDTSYTEGKWDINYTAGTAHYEPCQNELNDAFKGANVIPDKPTCIVSHGERLYLSGDSSDQHNVFITDISNPFYTPVSLPMGLPQNSDKVVSMKVFMDTVVVGRNHDIHVIYGNSNRTDTQDMYYMKRFNTHTGFAGRDSQDALHNYLFFLGTDGKAYAMHTTQTSAEVLASHVVSKNIDLYKYPIEATDTQLANAKSFFHNDEWILVFGGKMLVYSYKFMAWTLYSGFNASKLGCIDNTFLIGTNEGTLLKWSDDYRDGEHTPIQCWWASKRLDMDEPSRYKQFREMYVVTHIWNDFRSKFNVRFEIDYVDVAKTVEIASEIARWGVLKFGQRFITRNIVASLPIPIGQRGRKIRVIVKAGETIKFRINTISELSSVVGMTTDDLCYVADTDSFQRYTGSAWEEEDKLNIFVPFKVDEINGEFERRGKR